MAPDFALSTLRGSQPRASAPTGKLAWMNQATRRHCHFGLKSAPQHRDFRPGKVGAI